VKVAHSNNRKKKEEEEEIVVVLGWRNRRERKRERERAECLVQSVALHTIPLPLFRVAYGGGGGGQQIRTKVRNGEREKIKARLATDFTWCARK
jgi:hypothetical protein